MIARVKNDLNNKLLLFSILYIINVYLMVLCFCLYFEMNYISWTMSYYNSK